MGRGDLAGAAGLELVQGVAQLHPEDAMFEAMLRGWQAQQAARGLREETAGKRERLVRRFMAFTGEYPWGWSAGDMGRVVAVPDVGGAPGPVDDPGVSGLPPAVHGVPDRCPLWLGSGVRAGIRPGELPGGDLP